MTSPAAIFAPSVQVFLVNTSTCSALPLQLTSQHSPPMT